MTDKEEVLRAVYQVDKRLVVIETEHRERWTVEDKDRAELKGEVKALRESLHGLKVRVAGIALVAAGALHVAMELLKGAAK